MLQGHFINEVVFFGCWGLIVAGVEVEYFTLNDVTDGLNLGVRVSDMFTPYL